MTDPFNTALAFWTKLDLPLLQKQLDEQGILLKDGQSASLLNRKNLATRTKEFRKLGDPEKLDQFKPLLKLYQNEIDTLTTKLKRVEGYFFDFYRLIAEAPDPKPLLEVSLDSVMESGEISQLKAEIDRLSQELARKADYEQLKKRLLKNEQQQAELLGSKVKAKEHELQSVIEEKESNWKEKEKMYEKTINELKTSNEVTALQLNNSGPSDNGRDSLAELEIVSRDAEYSKQRLLEVEKRNEELRRELSILKNNLQVDSIKQEYTRKVEELESENVLLIAELEQARKSLQTLQDANTKATDNLNKELVVLKAEIRDLKADLARTKDYDDIKSELQFLRQIDDEGSDEDDSSDLDVAGRSKNKVDSLLVQRNKALNNELIGYRSEHESLVAKIKELEEQYNESNLEIGKLTKLNRKLEEDLSQFDNNFNDTMSLVSGIRKPSGSILTSNTDDSTGSLLPIITKQRDRFRDRNNELDSELRKSHSAISDLKRQLHKLKQDNEELYERTRYLASKGTRLQPKPNVDLEANSYSKSYESKLHPIEQFRIREQERISSRLSPFERIFISLTRAVLATRTTRMLFLAYCMGLHLLVMLTTLHSTSLNAQLIAEVGMGESTGGEPVI